MKTDESDEWLSACKVEMDNFVRVECFEPAMTPNRVFKRKEISATEFKFKARLETYSSVATFGAVRLVLALATEHDLKVHHGGATNACLDYKIQIYVKQPDGFDDGTPQDLLLSKALYGLKQSGLAWFVHLTDLLIKIAIHPTLIVTVYVDDILVCSKTSQEIQDIFEALGEAIEINNLGLIKSILDINVSRDPRQVGTELDHDATPLPSKQEYQALIGSLLYCSTKTTPDVAYAVGKLTRNTLTPAQMNLNAARRVVAYLSSTRHIKIYYFKSRPVCADLVDFSDSS
ncbi:hypothetical protein AaE_000411 [Aphanomyces astaci]|uniref:Reverse transcriptase Ty1/copia-type domain-containing protein n=1 Tax=Aphanomyces astaci TaxID=112090 RepID=A0A6A5AZX3_APHAT|nr:hypothetical protein AaE_000411 [Aphanomyces astaci]